MLNLAEKVSRGKFNAGTQEQHVRAYVCLVFQAHLCAHVHSECSYRNEQHPDYLELVSRETMPSLVTTVFDTAKMVSNLAVSLRYSIR